MKYIYTAILTNDSDDSTVYARVPDLDGCVTTGKDLPDAIDQITDAASVWLVTAEDHGDPIAPARNQSEIDAPEDSVKTLIQIDTNAYRAETDTRSVRKNVSIPAWMAYQASKKGINISKVLQDGLRKRLDA